VDEDGHRARRRRPWSPVAEETGVEETAARGRRAGKGGAEVRPRPVAETTPEAAELAAFGQRTAMEENQRRVVGMRREK